jgi:hypothetical protein
LRRCVATLLVGAPEPNELLGQVAALGGVKVLARAFLPAHEGPYDAVGHDIEVGSVVQKKGRSSRVAMSDK